jgi:endonuclease/exonuclease/phosphatase family metal-dependent hydrolase
MSPSKSLPIRLLTHNIRLAIESPSEGEEKWNIRSSRIINELRFNTRHCPTTFICLQEVLRSQLLDILDNLNKDEDKWAYIGVGRDDGEEAGEYSPIFYQSAIWTLKFQKTVWLSDTPDRPSKSWDAASTRILTVGKFEHRESKKTIIALNTHLDDQGSRSRLEAAKIILEEVSHLADHEDDLTKLPIFLAGDFNSEPSQEAYETITSDDSPFSDLHHLVPDSMKYGDLHTFTGFRPGTSPPRRIDFLFINHHPPKHASDSAGFPIGTPPWDVVGYCILPNRFEDAIYSSDHRAVVGDLLLC